jgi:hypothetical protein
LQLNVLVPTSELFPFVVLFAEIESLRRRVKDKEKEVEIQKKMTELILKFKSRKIDPKSYIFEKIQY